METQLSKPRVLCVIGTRPEAVKLIPVVQALRADGWADVRVIATAQHRDLLDQIFKFFEIKPDDDLNLMLPNQSLADLTSRMIVSLDAVLARETPDIVLAQGDTTTVMVTALCCCYRRIPFGHVEAGLRTGEKYSPFPEEINRVLASHLGDLHFAPTENGRQNLLREGIPAERIHVTGNTVIDALMWASKRPLPGGFEPQAGRKLILVTAHRRENFGEPLEEICLALRDIAAARDVEILYPVHPNPNVESMANRLLKGRERIRLCKPLDYAEFIAAMKASYLILSDSGGVQEEAPSLGKPVLVLRDCTERPEGVAAGTAALVGPHRDRIVHRTLDLLDNPGAYDAMAKARNPYGDGQSSQRIVAALKQFLV
ncbi:UDP-N-acetylglucosamine 2-epimerase [Phycisphaerae bacterium RAS2]|nr:UDP-N-acetylglucosamine 2-epimerase [Phycisphaerae bacterium RAS2]